MKKSEDVLSEAHDRMICLSEFWHTLDGDRQRATGDEEHPPLRIYRRMMRDIKMYCEEHIDVSRGIYRYLARDI